MKAIFFTVIIFCASAFGLYCLQQQNPKSVFFRKLPIDDVFFVNAAKKYVENVIGVSNEGVVLAFVINKPFIKRICFIGIHDYQFVLKYPPACYTINMNVPFLIYTGEEKLLKYDFQEIQKCTPKEISTRFSDHSTLELFEPMFLVSEYNCITKFDTTYFYMKQYDTAEDDNPFHFLYDALGRY